MADSYEPDNATKLFSETDILEMIHQKVDAEQASALDDAADEAVVPAEPQSPAPTQSVEPDVVLPAEAPLVAEEAVPDPVVQEVPAIGEEAPQEVFPEAVPQEAFPESDELSGLGSETDGLEEVVEETYIFTERTPSFDEEHGTYIGENYEHDFSRLDYAEVDPRAVVEAPIPHVGDNDGAGYHVPGEGKSRSKLRPLLAFLLVGILAAGIVAAGAYGLELWGGKYPPNVVGLSETKATQALESKGFAVETKVRLADDGIGFVLEQNPTSDERVAAGSSVTIVVAANREMPEVVGLKLEEAEDLLSKAGAVEIKTVMKDSDKDEGTVISVTPEAGESFTAHQTIELTVAQKPVVPDVMGKTKAEAKALLESAGFKVSTKTLAAEDKTPGTVIEQDPKADSKLNPGSTVKLTIAEPIITNALHLREYFDVKPATIAAFLPKQGFSRGDSHTTSDGSAEVAYVSTDKGRIIFEPHPYSRAFDSKEDTNADPLKDGTKFVGIRWEVPASMIPANASSLSEDAVRSLMSTCGLENMSGSVTNKTITLPEGTKKSSATFICASGGDEITWTILIVNESSGTRAVVTALPRDIYYSYDLDDYGGYVRDFVAYTDIYGK